MSDPSRTAVLGPLEPFADGFVVELSTLGYTAGSAVQQMCLMAHLSRWLEAEGLPASELSPMVVERFCYARRAAGYRSLLSPRALESLLAYLRRLDTVPAAITSVPGGAVEKILSRFRRYLEVERGLVAGSSRVYVHWVRPFLEGMADEEGLDLARVDAAGVRRFVVGFCAGRSRRTTEVLVAALRALLRFLYFEGELSRLLVDAVPSVAAWRLSELPRRLEREQVQRLLGACDRETAQGRRDFAIVTVLVRLGLRACAVAALSMDDIDWRAGEFTAVGKGGRAERLPLPVDVGEAIVAYLRDGRPRRTLDGAVFVRMLAPYRALSSDGVSMVVTSAARRAGLGQVGAHRLRHTAASEMLRAGAGLPEIGQVLGHRAATTTAIYAKVDRDGLRQIARPWPGRSLG
ncbi:MAG TPA: site-specific integrase [Solirubrobacterales bacterium]|nr:site-specific integrase [Solirubrobacterales bacterium]